ncbi:TRAP transporter large permease [Antarcticimicrobium luteum]|uniref:TRAP transporter large permease protein n=1 Tax=Antarcticimicrobium luteum TaxID=2547397 RepID=A0A4R5V6J4_9RHOB|nr:TRAP transporter large permease [Antarcticimicrobium luteum]TDK47431.1 TRAP transporter large permease [Antarcticimicrobium luteum]
MDWTLVLGLMLGGLALLLLMGLPVAFAFLTVTVIGAYEVLGGERGVMQLARNAVQSIASFQLAPIPLFILMGELLFQTGVAHRAIDAVDRVVTRIPGRLAVVSVFGGTLFAALSGSTIANTAMLGSTLLPGMLKKGYAPTIAMGPIMASGAIAMLIPPSALAVLVGSLAGISIAGLLIAGVIPALLLSVLFVIWIVWRVTRNPSLAPPDPGAEGLTLTERWGPFLRYVAPLSLVFAVVIGSLLAGIATPTESAALGSVAALALGAGYRALSWKKLQSALTETVKLSVMILFIILISQTFAQVLSFSGATNGVIRAVQGIGLDPVQVLVGMIVILLIMGCFVDQVSMLMVTVPIFVPLAKAAGIDPLVLGVVYLLTMEIGLLTPPFGLILFVMRGVAPPEIRMSTIYASILPFVAIKLLVLALIVWQPALGTWLPSMIGR